MHAAPIWPDELDRRFRYHPPDEFRVLRHEHARATVRAAAEDLAAMLPPGREASLAVTHLEEALMWANAAIARSFQADFPDWEPPGEPSPSVAIDFADGGAVTTLTWPNGASLTLPSADVPPEVTAAHVGGKVVYDTNGKAVAVAADTATADEIATRLSTPETAALVATPPSWKPAEGTVPNHPTDGGPDDA